MASADEWRTFCPTCNRVVLGRRERPNHLLHFIVTFFTCGLWAIPWIIVTIATTTNPYLCTVCGTPGRNA